VPDLACGFSEGLGAVVLRHWPVAVRVALFSAAGRVSVLALGRVSVWVSLSGGIGLWPCLAWTNLCVGEKQSTQPLKPSRSQRTVSVTCCGHELLTDGAMKCRRFRSTIFKLTMKFKLTTSLNITAKAPIFYSLCYLLGFLHF